MKIAVVADSMSAYGGAERVIEQILALYPEADFFTLLDVLPPDQRAFLGRRKVRTSFLQSLPMVSSYYRKLLTWWPLAIEQLDVTGYDLVISSHHCVANGVLTRPGQIHVSYVHTPMRYAWDLQHEYLSQSWLLDTGPLSWMARASLHKMRLWDYAAAQRPGAIATNSHFVAERIRRLHRREARVIHPPVAVADAKPAASRGDYYVSVCRLVPYKRVDLLASAFARSPRRRLKIIGEGPEMRRVAALAGPNVEILGHLPTPEVRRLVAQARAYVFAGIEDFGIAAVEAQAAGTPVIAYGAGGLAETVRGPEWPHPTGLFFREQTEQSLLGALDEFEANTERFTPEACVGNAARFTEARFRSAFADFVGSAARDAAAAWPSQPDMALLGSVAGEVNPELALS